MTQSAHTRCWGVLLAFGLQLPATTPPSPPAGQTIPPSVATPRPAAAPARASAPTYKTAWTHTIAAADTFSLATSPRFTFTAGNDVPLEARHLATGDVAWTHRLSTWQSLVATDTLVFGVVGDHAYALDAATGQTRWVTQTTGANTRLTAAGRYLLMVSDTDVLLRDALTGTPAWNAGLTAAPSAPATIDPTGGTAAIALSDGAIVAFDLASGALRWRSESLDAPARALHAGGAFVYAGLPDGSLCALRDPGGRRAWCFSLRVPVAGAPLVVGEFVHAALLDGSLAVFDARSGSMRPRIPLGHRPAAGPQRADSFLVIPLTTGEFVLIDQDGRVAARVGTPVAAESARLLERAAVAADGSTLVTLTIAPGGGRRLTAYRLAPTFAVAPSQGLPPLPGPSLPALPSPPGVQSNAPPAAPAAPPSPASQAPTGAPVPPVDRVAPPAPVDRATPPAPVPAPSPFPRPR